MHDAGSSPAEGARGGQRPSRPELIRREPVRRETDRRITAGGLVVSATFLVLAVGSVLLPADVRRGVWLPVHLALPGAATVAIGAVLPFFVAALAATRPGPPAVRVAVLALLGVGAFGVSIGVGDGAAAMATGGGVLFVAGLVGLGWLLVTILGGALGSQRGLLPRAYGIAIANVTVGASLATLFVAGWMPVIGAWAGLKPAHAWLNVFGFVGLVIAATLVHLLPTILGARIALRASTRVALAALATGPVVVAAGYLLGGDGVARGGAVVMLLGAAAFLLFVGRALRARGRWTTDAHWHRFTSWSLAAGVAWYAVGIAVAAWRILEQGAVPAGWSIDAVAAPLAAGFVIQVLVGSWTHLVPAIGPGDQRMHARQRAILAAAALPRWIGLNVGVALVAVGLPSGTTSAVAAGTVLAGAALALALGLLARAMSVRGDASTEAVR